MDGQVNDVTQAPRLLTGATHERPQIQLKGATKGAAKIQTPRKMEFG